MMASGNSGEGNWEEHYRKVLRAAETGDMRAKVELARLCLTGRGGDADKAVALLEEGVKDKDGEAMWMLGVCCEYGMGTEQDIGRANDLYTKSSKAGSEIGQFLAENAMEDRGSGVMNVKGACAYEDILKNGVNDFMTIHRVIRGNEDEVGRSDECSTMDDAESG